ncbi:MAG: prolipoprotein diacylglyceryl transferase [Deltaproteobacteria bacterium]|jgi:phosphatidylglycerol:prolipoprotein diacylglycerol transferase|nr:prolipoprotein diacylglyceryl transferase [Deltaproteobacteria bacterium]
MLTFPQIDPVIFSIGPLQVRWYGLMYVLGFAASLLLVRYQIKKFGFKELAIHFENLNLVLIISLVLGGRLGYVLFYNLPYYLNHPAEIMATWQGGMSFHGGMLGLIIGAVIFCRIKKLDFWRTADFYVVTIPIGLGLGRIGNSINGELYGRVTDKPWGMVFPGGGPLPRHPSQLYESFLEGLILFLVLWIFKEKQQPPSSWPSGVMVALFFIFYGVFRFGVEFFREPDVHLGLIAMGMTMGQLLSSLMIVAGVVLTLVRKKQTA